MNDAKIESLIRSIAEIESLEQPTPQVRRSESCLGMSRLESLAAGSHSPSAVEQAHLDDCRVCDVRLRAFAGRAIETALGAPPALPRWAARLAPLAAAACLAMLLTLETGVESEAIGGIIPVHIEHTVLAARDDERCEASFSNTADQNCVVLAVFRMWDAACQCGQWQLYDWGKGAAVARALAGTPLNIAIDVTDMPSVEQFLVVALAHDAADLPHGESETEALLACLNSSPLETEIPEDITGYASALESCLPPGVTVVSHAFNTE